MSVVVSIGNCWAGLAAVKRLVIFGASYCDVGYDSQSPHPTPENPLGVEFPGITYCEPGKPNFVGHLVRQVNAHRENTSSILAYDYAIGGERADGVRRQVRQQFLPSLAPKPDWAPWRSNDTLFLTWVGINDCAVNTRTLDPASVTQQSIDELFGAQEEAYQAGARNFCFVDVPPTYKFPNRPKSLKAEFTVLTWNAKLGEAARAFAAAHPDATVLIWSSWHLFSRMFNDPESFGFREEDPAEDEGGIFVDGLHPTSAVHAIIAAQILDFLSEVSVAPQAVG
ncbi:carbohydrate esterase family 16 protein [Polyporus arcularius HHB13444]|uniref:Carbohydrate esterase family 16 protein n=1 Tax=Polyporus arcularius HHB13444 TaxID=1314778 RepID=A0A5C3NZD0_9APHY|nr:carbohydrate esterase family 16 protein [Polyporus arcularius HHB13444]